MTNLVVDEVASILRRKPYTIRTWINNGKFPNAKKVGGIWLIPSADVQQLLGDQE